MYEKVSPMHPDKLADRIGGALVDYAYTQLDNPKIAVEVMIGHGICHIIAETSVQIPQSFVEKTVKRIVEKDIEVDYKEYPQDVHLAENQNGKMRCGDNGIFKGSPVTVEQQLLAEIAQELYDKYNSDGKYLIVNDGVNDKLVICQSNAKTEEIASKYEGAIVNPLGEWTGGIDVDTGVTNRKIGSDLGNGATGGGICAKDCSKPDVSANIYCFLAAQHFQKPVKMSCRIGDTDIDGIPYKEIVDIAKDFIDYVGGFEKLAEWGLIRALDSKEGEFNETEK